MAASYLVLASLMCFMIKMTSQNPTNGPLVTNSREHTTSIPTWHEHVHKNNESSIIVFNVTLEAVTREESLYFIKELFTTYGNSDSIKLSDLASLLYHLGLGHRKDDNLKDHDHTRRRKSVANTHVHTHHKECQNVTQLLDAFHMSTKTKISVDEFTYLCPALIHQLVSNACHPHDHNDDKSLHLSHSHQEAKSEHEHDLQNTIEKLNITEIPAKVWGYSVIAVVIISLVGLLGVAVIPIMQKVFYNHLLQFLVALAIGALTGDALLHLLPHAIIESSSHEHDHDTNKTEEHDHSAAAWKGLTALGGILFFFVAERLLTIITVIKRNKNSTKQEKKKRCEKFCDKESNKASVGSKLTNRQSSQDECDQMVMLVHPNKDVLNDTTAYALKSYADAAHDEFLHQCDEEMASHPIQASATTKDDEANLELMEVSKSNVDFVLPAKGHSHGHGHAHAVPNSVAAVAWMVILGDGIHNFSDGLAIGAAFANSITGGISTSIAVFCHELPHEIGDFAVLLRAGMSIKQAVLYNCLSSLLCLIGMLIGVAIGNISSASQWIFALVGGMFLYIALVDMLPEMSSVDPKKGENPFLHLSLQVLGILLGSGIMLLIAVFENSIKKALN
ncbi:zinc transporter ZIP10-like isoform X2 [Biomphalaria glabrata]|uniref:Zinc transporter ZIP10-like isoform X2 n=1 Tax=Biomphalaria glabrata TaxID=6526 RepID=A0A9W3A146_BIOGL|nr:zinc transporter ZIP10-like isoform X2 [Biomphalaria glabrata]